MFDPKTVAVSLAVGVVFAVVVVLPTKAVFGPALPSWYWIVAGALVGVTAAIVNRIIRARQDRTLPHSWQQ